MTPWLKLRSASAIQTHGANRSVPDLDLLARQVYDLLKRRLSTEVWRDR